MDDYGATAPKSFFQRHRGKLLCVALALLAILAAGIAIPVAISRSRSGSSSSDEIEEPEDVVVAAPTPSASPSVSPEPSAEPLAIVADCTYTPDSDIVVMNPRVPAWPDADNFTWVETEDGITYRPDVDDPHKIWGGNTDLPRKYPFQVATEGTYMFSMLTTSNEVAEFNDVWAKFDFGQGLQFWNFEKGLHNMTDVDGGGTDWTKLFQNQNGTALGVYTVDNEGYQIATVDTLKPGNTYELQVAGRSSRFTINRIYVVRCEQETCGNTGFTYNLLNENYEGPLTPCVEPVAATQPPPVIATTAAAPDPVAADA